MYVCTQVVLQFMHLQIRMYVHTYIHIHVSIHTIQTNASIYIHTGSFKYYSDNVYCIHICMYTNMYVNTYIHIYTYLHNLLI